LFEHFGDRVRFLREGESTRDRIGIARVFAYMHLRLGRMRRLTRRIPSRRPTAFDLQLQGGPNLRVRACDVILFEVFAYEAYDIGLERIGVPETILDVGANIGLMSVYLAGRYPDARFVCVEPSPTSYALLRENLERNVPRSEAFNGAVMTESGSFRMVEHDNPGLTSIRPESEGAGTTVEAWTIPDVLDRAGIQTVDLMKLDVEGAEHELFEHVGDWGDRVNAVVAEVHPPMTVREAEERLAVAGFHPVPAPADPLYQRLVFAARDRSSVERSPVGTGAED
jgi:FkbM family methyltransferase